MNPPVEFLNRLAGAWAGLVWTVTWQSTLLVGGFAIVALGMRRSSPALRYWLWQIVAIKLLLMPLWGVSILLPGRDAGSRQESWPPARSGDETIARPLDRYWATDREVGAYRLLRKAQAGGSWGTRVGWQSWLFLGWGFAVACQIVGIARQRDHLKRVLSRAAPTDDPVLLALVAELSGRIGLRRPPKVLIADDVRSPFVCGLWHPALVLPSGLTLSLAPAPLRSVLFHELSHILRRDLLWDWIPASARLLYFFHPAAHYIVYRARLERELACDQAAMILTGLAAAGYATTLIEVVSRSSTPTTFRPAPTTTGLDGMEPLPLLGPAIEDNAS